MSFLCIDFIVGPARVLMWDPCPFGLPEMLTVAQVLVGGISLF